MAIKIIYSDISTNEVKIKKILVNIGDKIKINQFLLIIENEFMHMEIPSSKEGIVKEIKVTL